MRVLCALTLLLAGCGQAPVPSMAVSVTGSSVYASGYPSICSAVLAAATSCRTQFNSGFSVLFVFTGGASVACQGEFDENVLETYLSAKGCL